MPRIRGLRWHVTDRAILPRGPLEFQSAISRSSLRCEPLSEASFSNVEIFSSFPAKIITITAPASKPKLQQVIRSLASDTHCAALSPFPVLKRLMISALMAVMYWLRVMAIVFLSASCKS